MLAPWRAALWTFVQLSYWDKAAMVAGTIVVHDETARHGRSSASINKVGMGGGVPGRLYAFVIGEQELAEARLKESGGNRWPMVVALGALKRRSSSSIPISDGLVFSRCKRFS